MPDFVLNDVNETVGCARLAEWKAGIPDLHEFVSDYHRLQLEHWIWAKRAVLARGHCMDIGVYNRREWIGKGYFTFGERDCDVAGDIHCLPMRTGELDAVICSEVLEHTRNPFAAMAEIHRVLRPGGLLLASVPFLWPWHGIEGEYEDYWRITHQGWRLLLKDFTEVKITRADWTDEGEALYHQLRHWESWGFRGQVEGATGYFAEAVKAA